MAARPEQACGTTTSNICSPVHGLAAGADPMVRVAPSGMFVYSGLAFNRDQSGSSVFIARYTDDNNVERPSTIRYLDTRVIAQGVTNSGNPSLSIFLDKPAVAIDLNSAGTTCMIPAPPGSASPTETIQSFSVYVAWTQFTGPESGNNAQIMLSQSHDCGVTWSTFANPISQSFVTPADVYVTPYTNQGAQIAVDPNYHTVLVVWRIFKNQTTGDSDAIAGLAFEYLTNGTIRPDYPYYQPFLYQGIQAFDQAELDTETGSGFDEFRTNDYPAIAIDASSNVYVVWSAFGTGNSQDTRIMLSFQNVSSCAPCNPDSSAIPFYAFYNGGYQPIVIDNQSGRGNQIMPAIAVSAGKVTVAWYDFRNNDIETVYTGTNNPNNEYTSTLQPSGNFSLNSGAQFGSSLSPNNVVDPDNAGLRNTVEVWADQAIAPPTSLTPQFGGSILVSSYAIGTPAPNSAVSSDNNAAQNDTIEQLEFNAPNLPLFDSGLEPFLGDYMDVAGPTFIVDSVSATWRWNNRAGDPELHTCCLDGQPRCDSADGRKLAKLYTGNLGRNECLCE